MKTTSKGVESSSRTVRCNKSLSSSGAEIAVKFQGKAAKGVRNQGKSISPDTFRTKSSSGASAMNCSSDSRTPAGSLASEYGPSDCSAFSFSLSQPEPPLSEFIQHLQRAAAQPSSLPHSTQWARGNTRLFQCIDRDEIFSHRESQPEPAVKPYTPACCSLIVRRRIAVACIKHLGGSAAAAGVAADGRGRHLGRGPHRLLRNSKPPPHLLR